ncbi:hypothetical protein [Streptomyces sp. 142MFCol3.1]|nr:hypothetical protein [Streptomyces sp. 142MFCol3.1]
MGVAVRGPTAVDDLARPTGRGPQQIIDQYETDIIADREGLA